MISGSLGDARTWSSTSRANRPASLEPATWISWNLRGLLLLPTRIDIGTPLGHDFRRWRCRLLLAIFEIGHLAELLHKLSLMPRKGQESDKASATDHAHDCSLHSFTLEFLLRNATRQRDPTEQSIGISSSEWCKAANVHWKQENASSSPVRARSKADGILSELDTTSLTRPDLTMTSWRRFECNVLGHKLSSIVHTKHSSRVAQCWAASISCGCLRHSQ